MKDKPDMAKGAVQKRAEHCNDKKLASKRVQEQSSELFFAVFVKVCFARPYCFVPGQGPVIILATQSLDCVTTYGPTLKQWFDHFHTSLACFTAL